VPVNGYSNQLGMKVMPMKVTLTPYFSISIFSNANMEGHAKY
jgi:hypothetical protein